MRKKKLLFFTAIQNVFCVVRAMKVNFVINILFEPDRKGNYLYFEGNNNNKNSNIRVSMKRTLLFSKIFSFIIYTILVETPPKHLRMFWKKKKRQWVPN